MGRQAPVQECLLPGDKAMKFVGTLDTASRLACRICTLCHGLDPRWVDVEEVVGKVLEGLCPDMTDAAASEYAAETCAYMSQRHPDFSILAARLLLTQWHEATCASFVETCRILCSQTDCNGQSQALVSEELCEFVEEHADQIEGAIDYTRDFCFDYFALRTLERSFLLRQHEKLVERPQHLMMRVACGIHLGDLDAALETYDLMSRRFFTHASPTLFYSGTPLPQLSSCFLLSPGGDTVDSVYRLLRQCAVVSSMSGGIGVALSSIPAEAAPGTAPTSRPHGTVKGLLPVLKVFNETVRLADQGNGRRKGAFAVYLEPWHADIFEFLELRKNHGNQERRARDLFQGLWVPDLFMQRCEADADWTLFCPSEARDQATGNGLMDVWGEAFEELYVRLEAEGRGRRTIKARQLWFRIIDAQMETGMPYMLYKDSANRKSNQQNLGTIRCANLCTEVIQFTSPEEVAMCNLASISLPAFVRSSSSEEIIAKGAPAFDYEEFHRVVKVVVRNLNRIIDREYYVIDEARRSNLRHRPVGLGVQGFADILQQMRLPYESEAARQLNRDIFEALYFAACDASCELAARDGQYETFQGSPASEGLLQFDLWGVQPQNSRWDWDGLKARIQKFGLRNSLLVAPMPTATTAQILGNSEAFEPYAQNLFVRRVLSGEFVQLNRRLVEDLVARGLWTESLRQRLTAENGSAQNLEEVPADLKEIYKTAWEIKQKAIVDMAADRGPFVDQSQSLNIFMAQPTRAKLTSMHFHGWKRGLKTGMYYLRTQAAVDAVKVTVDVSYSSPQLHTQDDKGLAAHCSTGECLSCSA